jgi:hypothetical protein
VNFLPDGHCTLARPGHAYLTADAPGHDRPVVPIAAQPADLLALIRDDADQFRPVDDLQVLQWDPGTLPHLTDRVAAEGAALLLLPDQTVLDAVDVIAAHGRPDWTRTPAIVPAATYRVTWDRWRDPQLRMTV